MGSSYFCHLPLVLGKDKKKFSKRHGATYAQTFLDEGYLQEALVNYISLVGWSSGDEQEIFSKEELIEKFTIERINNASCIFDFDKLLWINGMHIRVLSTDDYINRVKPFIEKVGLNFDEDKFRIITKDIQERTKILSDVPERVDFLFKNEITRDISSMFKKGIDKEKAILVLDTAKTFFENEENFSLENSKKLEEDIYAKFHELGFHMGGSFWSVKNCSNGKSSDSTTY